MLRQKNNSGWFRSVPASSKTFGTIPNGSERFRVVPNVPAHVQTAPDNSKLTMNIQNISDRFQAIPLRSLFEPNQISGGPYELHILADHACPTGFFDILRHRLSASCQTSRGGGGIGGIDWDLVSGDHQTSKNENKANIFFWFRLAPGEASREAQVCWEAGRGVPGPAGPRRGPAEVLSSEGTNRHPKTVFVLFSGGQNPYLESSNFKVRPLPMK